MYNFNKMTDRRGVGSLKWDVPEGELPMWVAALLLKLPLKEIPER